MTERIVLELAATKNWTEIMARVGVRARFCCEYCDLDFYGSAENYKQWQCDHIIPRRIGHPTTEDFDNLAASCRTCNVSFKGKWDPRRTAGQAAARHDLIQAVRTYIDMKKKETEKQMQLERGIIVKSLSG